MMELQDVKGDKCWPFCVSLYLFLSLGTGAWNDVSMEDLQSCIMNQDDSRFFQELSLRSGGRNIHVEVPILSVQRDVKVFDRPTLGFFHFTVLDSLSEEMLQLGQKAQSECSHFRAMSSGYPAGMFAAQNYREMKRHRLVFMVAIRCPESTNHLQL